MDNVENQKSHSLATVMIGGLLFLSGCGALIFESTWFYKAALLMGSGPNSDSLVLAGFMGGIGLGSGLAASWQRPIRKPLMVFCFLELAIAAVAAVLIILFPFLERSVQWLTEALPVDRSGLMMIRAGAAFLIVLIPTLAMGATLPVLIMHYRSVPAHFCRTVGLLYGWNTLGAVAGAVAGGYLLVLWAGIEYAGWIGVLCNSAAALGGWALYLQSGNPIPAPRNTPIQGNRVFAGKGRWRLMLLSLGSGFCFLGMEVLWFRFLGLTHPHTAWTLACILSTLLLGIALGGMAASVAYRRFPTLEKNLPGLFASGAVWNVLTYATFHPLDTALHRYSGNEAFILSILTVWLVFPLSILSGLIYPAVAGLWMQRLDQGTRSTGFHNLFNTLGALMGALLTGWILLPNMGIESAWFWISFGYLGLSLGSAEIKAVHRRLAPAVGSFALCLFPWGELRESHLRAIESKIPDAVLLKVADGPTETALCYEHLRGGLPLYRRLVTNGYSMSSTDPYSRRYMELFALLPRMVHTSPKSALLICFGVGTTARSLVSDNRLETIDVVDISETILSLSPFFSAQSGIDPLKDPRVRAFAEDGRFFLKSPGGQYDLITGEPPPPKVAGMSKLYSEEFFRLAWKRLSQGGCITYWLPVYQLRTTETLAIMKAFLRVFPDATLWSGGALNWILMGTKNASYDPMRGGSFQVGSQTGLETIGLEHLDRLPLLFLAGAEDLEKWTRSTLPILDNYPLQLKPDLTAREPDSPFYREVMNMDHRWTRFSAWKQSKGLFPELDALQWRSKGRWQAILDYTLYPLYRPDRERFWVDLHSVLKESDLNALPVWMLGSTLEEIKWALMRQMGGMESHEIAQNQMIGLLVERDFNQAGEFGNQVRRLREGRVSQDFYHLNTLAWILANKRTAAETVSMLSKMRHSGSEEEDAFQKWVEQRLHGIIE